MSDDLDLILSALDEVERTMHAYVRPGHRQSADIAMACVMDALDRDEVVAARNRLVSGGQRNSVSS